MLVEGEHSNSEDVTIEYIGQITPFSDKINISSRPDYTELTSNNFLAAVVPFSGTATSSTSKRTSIVGENYRARGQIWSMEISYDSTLGIVSSTKVNRVAGIKLIKNNSTDKESIASHTQNIYIVKPALKSQT